MVVLLILLLMAIAAGQILPLYREKQYRDLVGFLLVWFFAAVFALLVAFKVPLPGMIEVLGYIYGRMGWF